jgi:hypothetical protein
VKEYLATLDDAAFGAASDVTPKFVSPSDPAAQWTGAMRGPAFFAYAVVEAGPRHAILTQTGPRRRGANGREFVGSPDEQTPAARS